MKTNSTRSSGTAAWKAPAISICWRTRSQNSWPACSRFPGEALRITPQNLVEFRNFATTPTSANGVGLTALAAEGLAATFEAAFPLLSESPDIYPAWKAIVGTLGIIGKQVHDARLVAVCHVQGLTHLLTFNVAHFARMAGFGPGLVVVDPASI